MAILGTKRKYESTDMSIHMTKDYSLFKKLDTNRDLNMEHLDRLTESMRRGYLICPIIVNDKFEIIDGQHRFTAAQNLGLPIYFFIVNGYGMQEVKVLNTTIQKWTKRNFLESFVKMGVEPYVQMDNFMRTYPDFTISVTEAILIDKTNPYNHSAHHDRQAFEDGRLQISNIDRSREIAEKLMMIKSYYAGFNRRSFVSAMMHVFRTKDYDHNWFIQQLERRPNALQDRMNIDEYRLLIEEVYNHKNNNKALRLRF